MDTILNSTKFAKRLQKIMDAQELSATAFAEKIDVGRATISHLMSGRNKPSLDFVMKVVSTFPEVDLTELLYGIKKTSTPVKTRVETLEKFKEKKRSSTKSVGEHVAHNRGRIMEISKGEKKTEQKKIERIVIFYNDGTFTEHQPDD